VFRQCRPASGAGRHVLEGDARYAWGVSNGPAGNFSGAGQAVFWGVAVFDLKVGLEYDSLTPRERQAYLGTIHALRKMTNLPITDVTGREAAEYKHDLRRLNHFFGTRGYV